MKITDVIYEEEDERDYEDCEYSSHMIGKVHFILNDGSKAITRFKVDYRWKFIVNSDDVTIQQPKIPFFVWGKKREWFARVHRGLKNMTADRVKSDLWNQKTCNESLNKDKNLPAPLRSNPKHIIS